MAKEKIGKLDCLVREGDSVGHNIVILHGFGADSSDLFPLAEVLDPEGEWNFYFPNAPIEVPIGNMWTGRGWFPISVRDLEAGIDFTKVRPPGMTESAQMVGDLLFHLNSKKLVLGGFSQGAMISVEVALENTEALGGLLLWSGAMLDEANWRAKAGVLKGTRFLQSHGMQDQVIPVSAGQKLFEMLKSAGAEGEFIGFAGAHEIPMPVLKKSRELLKGVF